MRRCSTGILLSAAMVVWSLAAPAASPAGCSFDAVARPTKFRSSLVRAFAPCPAAYRRGPDTQTSGGTPACAVTPERTEYCNFCPGPPPGCNGEPVCGFFHPPSVHSFGTHRRSGCDVEIRWQVAPDCRELDPEAAPPLPARPCQTAFVTATCRGVVQDDGETPINAIEDAGWSLQLVLRVTVDDPEHGPMTIYDFPLPMPLAVPRTGVLKLKDNITRRLSTIFGADVAALPVCTQMKVVDVVVRDPDGARFATMGMGTRP